MNISISGMGVITCLGNTTEQIWDALSHNKSGIQEVDLYDVSEARSKMAGQIKEPYSKDGYNRMKEFSKIAIYNAIQDAGLTKKEINENKSILVIGTSLGHMFQNDSKAVMLDDYVPEVLKELDLKIPYISVSTACSSGTDAISMGADFLEFNEFEIVICGGVDVLDIYKTMGHSSLQTLAPSQCIPFSHMEHGTTLGEGAAFIVLQDKKHMTHDKYGIQLIGRSNTTDTISVTNPDINGTGAIRLIQQTCGETGIESIGYINAHGSGTDTNDKMESNVYKQAFCNTKPCISSTKGAFGHTLGATGAIEAVVVILSLLYKEAPPNVGCEIPSKEWDGENLVLNQSKKYTGNGISVTYGFGGTNAALLFQGDKCL
ncbi:beta-ketoacyl-[acyl-carrier-protein] synthase family protein [Anaeromicropila populeti]|uniref:3-oxoacyl-[acyl-carrier-protein] synthase II n=1 Tax=Anaeromicropila populeti TaxID=37658 RepID=A0A1I6HST0_9FIRM|nr:beta-ketoacyl-[acyl-carrier-protein] synthase family protein [Anaeromicropila populeti]SFR57310.1 3-oxoacyl-[acyl-carrier-protein] synthase II [Anaeromicropila populeti]